MEGAGVQRNIVEAASCFRLAGNSAELAQLAAMKQLYATVSDEELAVSMNS